MDNGPASTVSVLVSETDAPRVGELLAVGSLGGTAIALAHMGLPAGILLHPALLAGSEEAALCTDASASPW